MQQREPSASESYFWPSVWAIGLHVLVFALLFVSFAMTPEPAAFQTDRSGYPVPAQVQEPGDHPDQSEDCRGSEKNRFAPDRGRAAGAEEG